MKLFKNIRTYGWYVLTQTRPSYFHGVEELFRLDVMLPIKHNQVDCWAALPNIPCHGPAHFAALKNRFVLMLCRLSTTFKWTDVCAPPNTVQGISRCWKNLFVWMVWNFSKTFQRMAGPCSPKHGPVLFTVLKILFVWMFCNHVNTSKFMAGPRSPTTSVTAQLNSRRWRIVSFWCYANIQQRSNERTFVLPQTRSRAFHGVEELFRLDEMKLFKNIRTYGWVVLPQTRPSSVHGVEESICVNVLQPCKNTQNYGWAALSNISCHDPAHFAALKIRFVLWLCRHSTTFKWTDGRALPNTVERIPRFLRTFIFMMVSSFWKTFELVAGPCSPKHGPVFFTVLRNTFVWMLCSLVKPFKFMAGPCSPTSPLTAQLISPR